MKYLYLVAAMILASGCTDSGQAGHAPFLGTSWNLAELYNEKIQHPGPQVPHLRFEADKVIGNDGCNNFSGGYTLEDNSLRFGLLASTRMACPQINDFDMKFNKMVSATTRYRITGNKLELLENEKLLASFLAAE